MPDQNDGGSPGQNYSKFPNGISVTGYGTAPAVLYPSLYGADYQVALGTVIVPTGGTTIAPTVGGQVFGSAVWALATPYGDLGAGAGYAGVFAQPKAGGSVTFTGISGPGTASTASGTATYIVYGTY